MKYPGQRDNEAIIAQLSATLEHIQKSIDNLNKLDAPGGTMATYCVLKECLEKDLQKLGESDRQAAVVSELLDAMKTVRNSVS